MVGSGESLVLILIDSIMDVMLAGLMNAISKGLNDIVLLAKEKGKPIAKEMVSVIMSEGKSTLEGIKQDTQSLWSEFKKELREMDIPANIVTVDVEFLNSKRLLEIAKENIVPVANEVYAIKKQKSDAVFVYLAYGKDKEPFSKEQNKYVIIKAEGLSADVLGLFSESELVILK